MQVLYLIIRNYQKSQFYEEKWLFFKKSALVFRRRFSCWWKLYKVTYFIWEYLDNSQLIWTDFSDYIVHALPLVFFLLLPSHCCLFYIMYQLPSCSVFPHRLSLYSTSSFFVLLALSDGLFFVIRFTLPPG